MDAGAAWWLANTEAGRRVARRSGIARALGIPPESPVRGVARPDRRAEAKGMPVPPTKESTMHLLVATATRFRRVVLAEYPTYDEAVAAFAAVDAEKGEYPAVQHYAVRSADDPGWNQQPRAEHMSYVDLWNPRTAATAVVAYLDAELGRTARWAVEKGARDALSFNRVQGLVTESLRARGWTVAHVSPATFLTYSVQQAVKSRTLLGRCRNWGSFTVKCTGAGRGYWLPKSEGPLRLALCPCCDQRLAQTTLSLRSGFARLTPAPVPA